MLKILGMLLQLLALKADNSSATFTNNVIDGVNHVGNAFDAMDLYVNDSYGHSWEQGDAQVLNYLYGITLSATNVKGGGTVSINANGDILITGNVTSFDVAAYSPSGQSANTSFTVAQQ